MMNDDFLHRLRKEPRPQFAARLQARLRRQSTSPAPKAPSRARTLLTLLLLGGAAFAVTAVVMRGLPPSLLSFYHNAAAWIAAERAAAPAHRAGREGMRGWLQWGGSGYSPHDAAARGSRTAQSAGQTSSSRAEATAAGSSASTSAVGGVPSGRGLAPITVVTSWSAYPYVYAIVNRVNFSNRHTIGANVEPQVDISVRDSHFWPQLICKGGPHAPDMAYAFAPRGQMSNRPCPRDASDSFPVIAVPVGYEAVALARSPLYGELDLTRRQIFLALAKWIPDPARPGTVRQNASATWRQVDPALGSEPIEFMGPPLASAAGRSMIELLMEAGCDTYPWIAELESTHPDRYARICRTVRTDGVYTEISALTPANLLTEPNAVGIFAFGSRLTPPLAMLARSRLDGVEPTVQGIESGTYPGSRALYLFRRHRHIPPMVLSELLYAELPFYPDWAFVPPSQQDVNAAWNAAMGGS